MRRIVDTQAQRAAHCNLMVEGKAFNKLQAPEERKTQENFYRNVKRDVKNETLVGFRAVKYENRDGNKIVQNQTQDAFRAVFYEHDDEI